MAVTWNPSDKSTNVNLSNGNLTLAYADAEIGAARATRSESDGKWYWEIIIDSDAAPCARYLGIATSAMSLVVGANASLPGRNNHSYGLEEDGDKWHNDSQSNYGNATDVGDIVGVALDLDNGKIWWSINGVWQASGDPAAGTNPAYTGVSGTYFPAFGAAYQPVITARFDRSDWSYSPPVGFGALEEGSNLLDGKVTISPKIDLLDGAVTISPKTVSLDGKARIKDVTINLLDGKARVKNVATNLLDGEVILHPIIEADITLPLFVVDAESGSNTSLNEALPLFDLEAFSGATVDIELPKFEVEAIGTVGSIYEVDVTLPSLSIEAKIGSQVDIELPKLNVSTEALIGVTAEADLELQFVKLDASALLDILANLDVSLPKLLVASSGIYGAVVSGDVKLYPLRLSAEGYAGELGTVDISLSSLVVEAELSHVPVGEGDVEFPSFAMNAELTLLRDSCLDLNILEYCRWS